MSELAWDPYDRDCPTRQLLDRIGDRWTVLVINTLDDGPRRYSELARRIDGISQKMLAQTLRTLEFDGLVTRTVYPEVPPRVEYALTDLGRSLQEPLAALEEWATAHMARVLDARRAHRARIVDASGSGRPGPTQP
ncbi:winged helix-turn-helix transcriptional regulator [Nostocoides japonicum]|nr:helix-turn-helix domain-containing protein [Tetrasphaera japonica]